MKLHEYQEQMKLAKAAEIRNASLKNGASEGAAEFAAKRVLKELDEKPAKVPAESWRGGA